MLQAAFSSREHRIVEFRTLKIETHGIFQQARESPPERPPRREPVSFIDLDQFGEQMKEATLLGPSLDQIIGAVKVADQDPVEHLPEHPGHYGGTSPLINQVVTQPFGTEGP